MTRADEVLKGSVAIEWKEPVVAPRRRVATPRPLRAEAGFYKGPLTKLERAFLDLAIARGRFHDQEQRPRRYYNSEVELAKKLSERWQVCLSVMTPEEAVGWSRLDLFPPFPPVLAIQLQERGVTPDDIRWKHPDDRGEGTLSDRLTLGQWTINQVVTTVEWRREHTGD